MRKMRKMSKMNVKKKNERIFLGVSRSFDQLQGFGRQLMRLLQI